MNYRTDNFKSHKSYIKLVVVPQALERASMATTKGHIRVLLALNIYHNEILVKIN